MMLRRDLPYARVVVPDHRQLRSGTIRRIIADAGSRLTSSSNCFDVEPRRMVRDVLTRNRPGVCGASCYPLQMSGVSAD